VLRLFAAAGGSFLVEVLPGMISFGYGGEEVPTKFAQTACQHKKAMGALIDQADKTAGGRRKGAATEEILGEGFEISEKASCVMPGSSFVYVIILILPKKVSFMSLRGAKRRSNPDCTFRGMNIAGF
jgi:hypothetical protein